MVVLDTNVLSALMRDPPDDTVVTWLDGQPQESVWTTSITVFEVRFGLARMPSSRRRSNLEDAFEALIEDDLAGRVLSLDRAAADRAAQLAALREAAGRPTPALSRCAKTTLRISLLASRARRHPQPLASLSESKHRKIMRLRSYTYQHLGRAGADPGFVGLLGADRILAPSNLRRHPL
ncbi:MAG: PIN domain-containing protein [Thiohalocapsa sp. PB-PSB1]|nr:MAG: PIN domain-containing protein [Thiohalocapsa sp. PB-PSB1]HCS89118.1 VapC toxin family PIN domain ribonuclease [Chromatiaceae bacterium]